MCSEPHLSLVGDLGDVSSVRVRGVLHGLQATVRQSHGVGAHRHASLVLGLGLRELRPAADISCTNSGTQQY